MTKSIAHRGFSGLYPENTLLSFEKALEFSPDCLELDIHLTKDNKIVICHDTTIDRTCDGKGNICDYTLAELKKFDASYRFRGQYGINAIPSLDEYFELIEGKNIITLIEFKGFGASYPGLDEMLIAELRRRKLCDKVVVSGFNHYQMVTFKELAPEISVGLPYHCDMVNPGKYGKELGMDYLHSYYQTLSAEHVDEIHSYGLKINAWTTDDPVWLRNLISRGVDGVMTNRIDIMTEVLKEFK